MYKNIIAGMIACLFLFSACKGNQQTTDKPDKQPKDSAVSTPKEEVKELSNYNDQARFFAGLKPLKDEALLKLTADSAWIKHSALMNAGFNGIEKNRLAQIRKWRDVELNEANSSGIKTLFYPLSGPDFLNAFTLFPNHQNYIMAALEPSGQIKDVTKMKPADFTKYMGNISASLTDIFRRSYFITKKMSGDFSKWKIQGNLPTMMVFLARTGNTILNIRRVAIGDDGQLHHFNINDSIPRKYISKGVHIDFKHDGDSVARNLYYFSTNLGDQEYNSMVGLDVNKGLITWVESFGDFNSYCKAASYLFHYGTFSIARNLILSHSKHHLQDDSGIAYRYFDPKKWSFKYYGKYSRPIDEFRKIYEKDLEAAMKADSLNVKDVPFKLGYHWGKGTVNILYAKRIN
jgi:hypothetical protein